jgi:hypothetical protein
MEELSAAGKLRRFFEDLFQSRLVTQLDRDLLYSRSDAERMRQEYQGIIADLRAEKAQLEARILMYDSRNGLRPVSSQSPVKPVFDFSSFPPVKTKWQIVQEQHDAQMAKELEEEKVAKIKDVASAT